MIFAVGPMVQIAMQAAIELMGKQVRAGVVDARFIKPMDEKLILEKAAGVQMVVTLEENSVLGGLGEGVAHVLAEHGLNRRMLILGAPDGFVSHARISQQRRACGLSLDEICRRILEAMNEIRGGEK